MSDDDDDIVLEGSICMDCLIGHMVKAYYLDAFIEAFPGLDADIANPHQITRIINSQKPEVAAKWNRCATAAADFIVEAFNHATPVGSGGDDEVRH